MFSYSLLWYSIAQVIIFYQTQWKLSKYKRNSTKKEDICWNLRPFWKKRPHGFIQHWDFCRQPDFNSPMAKVSKNSGLQKSPGGCRVLVTIPNKLVLRKETDIIHLAMGGGVKKVFTLGEGGSKSSGGLRRGAGSKKFDDKNFQLPSPPHQSIYEHSLISLYK